MQIISIHHPYQPNEIPEGEIVLALGYFDGVHMGHQAVINTAKAEAKKRGAKVAVMSFNQHPSIVYQKLDAESMKYLSILDRKIELMEQLEVDLFYIIDFTYDFGTLKPQEFVDEYIVALHASAIVAGFDYTYGPKDIANMEHLPIYAKDRFDIIEVPALRFDNHEKISSTSIREALDAGDMETVNRMLGYTYQFEGPVMHGDARGRLLGYPTANIEVAKQIRLPKAGVYVVSMEVRGEWFKGMAQIGYNITFEANRPMTVEVNVFDFDRIIYGETVRVAWHHFLRAEERFDSMEALVAQLDEDKKQALAYFEEHPLNP